ncbi:L-histidine N(alpha)-methyltransferase [soil metagenome]
MTLSTLNPAPATIAPPAPATDVRVLHEVSQPDQLDELRRGLLAPAARIEPKFFYDEQGGALFGAIVELDEYYLPRAERQIFERERGAIAARLPAPAQWVDLGCGDCAKSRAWLPHVNVDRYIGVDIASDWLRGSLQKLGSEFADIDCIGAVCDFMRAFDLRAILDERSDLPPVFFYPGSSLGNFAPDRALAFLSAIHGHCDGGGALLIGIDLVKDVDTLERAYDDRLGVTAAFNRNVLRVVNRLLGSDFPIERFDHRARFNAELSRIEMHLVAREAVTVGIPMDDGRVAERRFEAGEAILTECSYKYRRERFARLLEAAGFTRTTSWTDDGERYAVFLAS